MALVQIISTENNQGREIGVYIDTDDLSQADYYEYCRVEKDKGKFEALKYLTSIKIL